MKLLIVFALLCALVAAEEEHVVVLNAENFDTIVKQGDIVVEFYAPWCGHCKKLAPEYEKAAKLLKETNLKVKLAKCDADDKNNKPIANRYGVKGFPTIRLFRNGSLENPEEYNGPRTADGIVAEVKKLFGPASMWLKSKEEAQRLATGETVLIGVFAEECKEYEVYLQAAEKLRGEKYDIAHTFNPKLLEACTADPEFCTGSMVFMLKGLDKNVSKFSGDFEVNALVDWAIKSATPRLTELIQSSPRHMKKVNEVFRASEPRYIAFADPDDKELEAFKEALIEVDEADDSFNVIFIDASVNSKAARYFGLSESDYPSLVMHDHANGKKFIHKEATPADVKTFVAQWKAGELEETLKSEDPPKDDSGPVKVVVGKTFKEVLSSGKDVLMEFYAPWCGHCKKLAPIYDNLGKHFKDNADVIIAKIDATNNDIPDGRFEIKGFPTLKYVKKGGEIVPYEGDRSLEDLIKFVSSFLGTSSEDPKAAEEESTSDSKEEL